MSLLLLTIVFIKQTAGNFVGDYFQWGINPHLVFY